MPPVGLFTLNFKEPRIMQTHRPSIPRPPWPLEKSSWFRSGARLAVSLIGALAGIAPAQNAISWNYDYAGTVTGTNVAGIVPVSNWNNSWPSDPRVDLLDSNGAASTLDINYASYTGFLIVGYHPGQDADTTYNRELLNGFLASGPAPWNPPITESRVVISQIPYAQYNIIVYFGSDGANRPGYVTDDTTRYYFSTIGQPSVTGANAILTQSTQTDDSAYPLANYAIFSNLTGASKTIRVQMRDNDLWGGISGFQVVEVQSGSTPDFVTNPQNRSVVTGEAVALEAAATGSPAPTYQWQFSSTGSEPWTDLSGETSGLLIFTAQAGNAGFYRAVATNTGGSDISGTAEVTVTDPQEAISWNVSIDGTLDPVDGAGVVPSANWNNAPGPNGFNNTGSDADLIDSSGFPTTMDISFTSGFPSAAHTLGAPVADADGRFNRRMINGYLNGGDGNTGAPVTVTLNEVPYAVYDVIVYVGSDVAGRTGTISDGTTTFDFTALGVPSVSGSSAVLTQSTSTGGSNPTANYVRFTNLTGSSKTFTAKVSPAGGISGLQVIKVPGGPVPVFVTQPQGASVLRGSSFALEAAANSTPDAACQWQFSADGLDPWEDIPGATQFVYGFAAAQPELDAGFYRLAADNGTGVVYSNVAEVSVTIQAPVITQQPVNQSAAAGGTVSFSVTAESFGLEGYALGYQWFKGGVPIPGQVSNTLNLTGITAADEATYSVEVTETFEGTDYVTVSNSVTLTLLDTLGSWLAGYPGVGTQTGVDDDPDGDGYSNGVENVFGTDPSQASAGFSPLVVAPGVALSFDHPLNASIATDLVVSYQWSVDLATWSGSGVANSGLTVTLNELVLEPGTRTILGLFEGGSPTEMFVRMVVTQAP